MRLFRYIFEPLEPLYFIASLHMSCFIRNLVYANISVASNKHFSYANVLRKLSNSFAVMFYFIEYCLNVDGISCLNTHFTYHAPVAKQRSNNFKSLRSQSPVPCDSAFIQGMCAKLYRGYNRTLSFLRRIIQIFICIVCAVFALF
jgi:hypothetical protein